MGYVYVVIGTSNKLQIPVTQKGLFIETDVNTLSFSANAEQKKLSVSSNFEWAVLACPEWLTLSPMTGSNTQSVIVSSQRNENTSSRRGSIKIGKEGLSISANIDVVQEGMTLSVDNNTIEFADKASSQNITITTTAEWNASCNENWIHLSKTNGIGNSELSVSVDENVSENSRTGLVTITAGDLTQTIKVIQSGKYFNIDTGDKTFTSTGGTMQISFSTNESWTASLEQAVPWLTLSSTSGNGNGMITVTVKDNASMKARENAIVISPANSSKVRVSIKQSGRYLTVDCTELNFERDGGTSQDITINSDGLYEVISNESWISIKMKTSYVFNVTASKNDENGIRREGTIMIRMKNLNDNENYALTLYVSQYGTINGHEFVDLGLPSGTKWAKYSIGSSDLYFPGEYYTWTKSSNIVKEEWGGTWTMPSKTDIDELYKYCKRKTVTFQGKTWSEWTGPNGNVLILPAGGIYNGINHLNSSVCYYWTSTLGPSGGQAYLLEFSTQNGYAQLWPISYKANVRAVSKEQ